MVNKNTPEIKDDFKSKFIPHVRDPAWYIKARVPFESLTPGQCRYTPSEEQPYLFCGDRVVDGKSWCKDCENIVYYKEEDGK